MKIVYENSELIFVEKKSMVLTVPPRMKDSRPVLGWLLQEKCKIKLFPVHRLDYEVSGIVGFAKSEKSHRVAQSWFEERKIIKFYEAQSELQSFDHWPLNVPNHRLGLEIKVGESFRWESKILRGKKRSFFSAMGEFALTEARVEKIRNHRIVWILNPITGKPHQLRLELCYRGFPICGDALYGSKVKSSDLGIDLNSYLLDFTQIRKEQRLDLPNYIEIARKFL